MEGTGLDVAPPEIWLHIFGFLLDSTLFHTSCTVESFYDFMDGLSEYGHYEFWRRTMHQRMLLNLVCKLWKRWAWEWGGRYAVVKRIFQRRLFRFPLTSRTTYVLWNDYTEHPGSAWNDIMIPFLTSCPVPRLRTLSIQTIWQRRTLPALWSSARQLPYLRTLIIRASIDAGHRVSLETISNAFPHLQTLALSVSLEGLEGTLRLSKLEVLRLESMYVPNDWDFPDWDLPSLTYLYLAAFPKLIDISIMGNLLQNVRCLEVGGNATFDSAPLNEVLPVLEHLFLISPSTFYLAPLPLSSRLSHLHFTCRRAKELEVDAGLFRETLQRGIDIHFQNLSWAEFMVSNHAAMEACQSTLSVATGVVKDCEGELLAAAVPVQ